MSSKMINKLKKGDTATKLRLLEAVALSSSVFVAMATYLFVGQFVALEANPVMAAVIELVGWNGFAVAKIVTVGLVFGVLELVDDRRFAVFAGAWGAFLMLANAATDAHTILRHGLPETFIVSNVATYGALVGALAFVVYYRRLVPVAVSTALTTTSRPPSRQTLRRLGAVALVVVLVTSGIGPFTNFSSIQPAKAYKGTPGDTVFVGSCDSGEEGVEAFYSNGTSKWTNTGDFSSCVNDVTTGPEGYVYAFSDSKVMKLYPENGTAAATIASGLSVSNGKHIAASSDGVYIGYHDGSNYQLEGYERDGSGQLFQNTGQPASFMDILSTGDLVVGQGTATVTKYDPVTGSSNGTITTPSSNVNDVHAPKDSKVVYLGYDNGIIEKFTEDGTSEWTYDTGAVNGVQSIATNPDDTKVYAGGYDGSNDADLTELDPVDGSFVQVTNVSGVIGWDYLNVDESGNIYGADHSDDVFKFDSSFNQIHTLDPMSSGGSAPGGIGIGADTHGAISTGKTVAGTVTDQNGEPVENATVELVGVDTTKISTDPGETAIERSNELLKESSDPLPDSYDSDLDLTGEEGFFETASAEYVAVHEREDWAAQGWIKTIELGNPSLNAPAEEPLRLSVWSPTLGEGTFQIQNTVDDDLPGATVKRNITIERLDPLGDVVDAETYEPTGEIATGIGPGRRVHHYLETTLSAGVYRVYAEGAENQAYTIVVGDEQKLRDQFATDLENEAGGLTNAAERLNESLSSGKYVRLTATTNATGEYSASVGENIDVVAVSAYKIDGEVLTDLSNPTPQDMRAYVMNNDYNGSVYMSLEPRRYETPETNADVTVRKFSSPPYELLDSFASRWSDFRDLVENGTLTDLSKVYRVPLSEWNETQLQNGAENLTVVVDGSDELISAWEDRTNRDFDRLEEALENESRTNDELREDIRSMEQTIGELEDTLEKGESSTDVGRDEVNFRQVFDGDFEKSDVSAVWHDNDGTSTPIEREHISVNKRTGRGDEVVIDYLIPNESTGGTISVFVVDEDGDLGRASERVDNPASEGEAPDLRSIDVSTYRPGVNETVTLDPKVDTAGVTLEQVEVFDEDGNTVSSSLSNGEATFTPSSAGNYFVRFTFNDSEGTGPYVETLGVAAGETPFDFPETVVVKEGRLGVYALAGDDVDDAKVSLSESGQTLEVTALIEPDAGTNEVHYHLEDTPASTRQALSLRVVEGDTLETASSPSRHIGAYVHGREIRDDAVVYRRGPDGEQQPIPDSGTRFGKRVEDENGGTVIQTYTEKTGSVVLDVNNDPSRFESAAFTVRVWLQKRDLPFAIVTPPIGLGGLLDAVALDVSGLLDVDSVSV